MFSKNFYLVVSQKTKPHGALSIRISERKPSLKPGEVPISVELQLPDTLFKTPTLQATIKVPESKVAAATVTAEVAQNIEKLIKDQMGISLHVKVG